ncbi:expressed unknown protein [Seminavis robusta]|uniref:Uncharacterized protein n=1 Tax=Seminavis robusta TaxID=568900 RepID=A0A9N8DEA8_9STRA|nr:expressed unknown protein [Seminavis robusta]|eukprot:Sro78_g042550.1 n/a (550) ;mRNA; r:92774-94423
MQASGASSSDQVLDSTRLSKKGKGKTQKEPTKQAAKDYTNLNLGVALGAHHVSAASVETSLKMKTVTKSLETLMGATTSDEKEDYDEATVSTANITLDAQSFVEQVSGQHYSLPPSKVLDVDANKYSMKNLNFKRASVVLTPPTSPKRPDRVGRAVSCPGNNSHDQKSPKGNKYALQSFDFSKAAKVISLSSEETANKSDSGDEDDAKKGSRSIDGVVGNIAFSVSENQEELGVTSSNTGSDTRSRSKERTESMSTSTSTPSDSTEQPKRRSRSTNKNQKRRSVSPVPRNSEGTRKKDRLRSRSVNEVKPQRNSAAKPRRSLSPATRRSTRSNKSPTSPRRSRSFAHAEDTKSNNNRPSIASNHDDTAPTRSSHNSKTRAKTGGVRGNGIYDGNRPGPGTPQASDLPVKSAVDTQEERRQSGGAAPALPSGRRGCRVTSDTLRKSLHPNSVAAPKEPQSATTDSAPAGTTTTAPQNLSPTRRRTYVIPAESPFHPGKAKRGSVVLPFAAEIPKECMEKKRQAARKSGRKPDQSLSDMAFDPGFSDLYND